jgi:hypothetical protein
MYQVVLIPQVEIFLFLCEVGIAETNLVVDILSLLDNTIIRTVFIDVALLLT